MAEKEGFLGMAFTNTSPLVFPTRGSEPTYGTNPISCFAPASNGDRFQLDMATTTGFRLIKVHFFNFFQVLKVGSLVEIFSVALGKVELESRKGSKMPNGWGADKNGQMTNDPKKTMQSGGLLPLGGTEKSGGYKG